MATEEGERRRPRAVRKRATRQSVRQTGVDSVRERSRRGKDGKGERRKKKPTAPEKPKSTKRVKTEPDRKAPTPLAEDKRQSKQRQRRYLVTTILILLGIAGSAAVGLTDSGQIDVNATIQARGNNPESEQTIRSKISLPVQNKTRNRPDGGLKGGVMTDSRPKKTETAPAANDKQSSTSTVLVASTTAQTASSSEGRLQEENSGLLLGDDLGADNNTATGT